MGLGATALVIRNDEDRSPTVSFADIFREYNFVDPVEIAMDEISPEDALLIESGSLIYVKYINSTGFVEDENGDVNPWSNTTWSFLELIPES